MDARPTAVRTCPKCGAGISLEAAIAGDEVRPIGMSFQPGTTEHNSYYFNHRCGSTFTLPVELFLPYIAEPVPAQALTGTRGCEKRCLRVDDLKACGQACRYAPFRRFLVDCLLARRAPPRRPALALPAH